MTLELRKAAPTRLRDLGLDERWLQDRIVEDPSLLGLGDLNVIRREKKQSSGGRIDFLMHDPDGETRYEIEMMLGALNESHIIRTIEYWDIERQRYPTFDHRAVIVAEEITSRLFNVIRLINRAVPIIALQLNAFRFGDNVVLHFTKVLDVYEEAEEDTDAGAEQADRSYWEKRANGQSMAIVDQVVAMVPVGNGAPRITYNKFHIALGTTGFNFCWFHPRKTASHCLVDVKTWGDDRDAIIARLVDAGVSAKAGRSDAIALRVTGRELQENSALIREVLELCEQRSRQ